MYAWKPGPPGTILLSRSSQVVVPLRDGQLGKGLGCLSPLTQLQTGHRWISPSCSPQDWQMVTTLVSTTLLWDSAPPRPGTRTHRGEATAGFPRVLCWLVGHRLRREGMTLVPLPRAGEGDEPRGEGHLLTGSGPFPRCSPLRISCLVTACRKYAHYLQIIEF